MKTKINDLTVWQKYCEIDLEIAQWNRAAMHEISETVPKEIRELFECEKFLTPGDMSHELLRDMFIKSCKQFAQTFIVDADNEQVIELFIQYLRRDEQFLKLNSAYRFEKGLLLRGNIGTGKTVLFKGFKYLKSRLVFFKYVDNFYYRADRDNFFTISSNKIAETFALDGYEILTNNITNRRTSPVDLIDGTLFIDDIGIEPIVSHYGITVNIIAELLIRRYERAEVTHATSNLGIDELKSLYGMRVFDRMKEMFNDISLPGESRRQ